MAYTIQGSSQFTTQFPAGTVNIKFSQLRNVFKGPTGTELPVGIVTTTGEIRARQLLRNTNTSDPDPIVPDATENTQVSTSSNWKVSQMRETIKFYVIDQTVSTTNDNGATPSAPGFDFDGLNWNNNLTKSIRKFATISGTCGSNGVGAPAVRMSTASNNLTVVVNSSARVYGAGGGGSGTYNVSGSPGGVALQVDSAQGAVKVYIAAGSNTYGGGGGGARGSAGLQGQTGTCPRDEYYDSGRNCGGCPGCAGGWNQYNCYSPDQCNCGKGGCGSNNYISQCTRTVYDVRAGAPRGEGGNGAQGRGYNNFSAALTGVNGTAGTPGGCYTYPDPPAGSGTNGETGGSGGDWGIDGSATTTYATALLEGSGAGTSPAGRAISRTGAGPGTGSGNYAILSSSTLTSTELKGYYQS
jgi:hypothetical protein